MGFFYMKEHFEKWARLARQALFPILSLFFFVLLLKQIGVYDRIVTLYEALIPILLGILIAFFFQPVIDRFQKRFSRKMSVTIVYGIVLIAVILLLVFIAPILYKQIADLSKMVPDWLNQIEALLLKFHIPLDRFTEMKETVMNEGIDVIWNSLVSGMGTMTRLAIGYMTGFFISLDLEFWIYTCHKVVPNYHRFTNFYKTMSTIIYQYLIGTVIDLLFIAVTVGIVLYLADFPNALLYAVILALFNLWPYIGATIGLLIIGIVSALSFPSIPILPLFIVWLIQQLESNIVQPLIFNKTMDVRPILTFISLFVSEALLGIIGVILSPIFAAIAQIIFRSYLHAQTSDEIGEWEDIWYDFDEVMKKVEQ